MYLCSKDNKNLTYLMYNIYFGKRCITLCTPDEKIIKDPNAVILRTDNKYNYSQIIEILESSPAIRHLMIYTESEIDSEFNRLRALFKEINAGGGVIENENKEFLLIFRDEMWDLPKGKQEPDEEISKTALREVEEECGISGMDLEKLLCITRHCYKLNGTFILKHTWWYQMKYHKNTAPIPQKEENITKTEWVKIEQLPNYLKETYPSIKEVFNSIISH
jgi:ADP-ribose pyrophosphatase YjhB (NUDIX family)